MIKPTLNCHAGLGCKVKLLAVKRHVDAACKGICWVVFGKQGTVVKTHVLRTHPALAQNGKQKMTARLQEAGGADSLGTCMACCC